MTDALPAARLSSRLPTRCQESQRRFSEVRNQFTNLGILNRVPHGPFT